MNIASSKAPAEVETSPFIHIYQQKAATAKAAAKAGAGIIRAAIALRGRARILIGTGNSQLEMVAQLTAEAGIDWSKVEVFHLDEYVGMSAEHPASFRLWLRRNFAEKVRPKAMHYIDGDAADLDATLREYGRRLMEDDIDLAFVGIGENGHVAFNDPGVANFEDPLVIKPVVLDDASRRQQVGEGHFPNEQSVPRVAITVSCSGLMRATHWVCCVPDLRKAKAVKAALEGPLSVKCPASVVRKHPSASIFLDPESASLLSETFVKAKCRVHA
jgi:glucosamine-6-phosphate deaminase